MSLPSYNNKSDDDFVYDDFVIDLWLTLNKWWLCVCYYRMVLYNDSAVTFCVCITVWLIVYWLWYESVCIAEWQMEYNDSILDEEAMKKEVDEYMAEHDARVAEVGEIGCSSRCDLRSGSLNSKKRERSLALEWYIYMTWWMMRCLYLWTAHSQLLPPAPPVFAVTTDKPNPTKCCVVKTTQNRIWRILARFSMPDVIRPHCKYW